MSEQENDKLRADSTQHRLKAKAFEAKLRVVTKELSEIEEKCEKLEKDLSDKTQV